ncbi:hypothetical protein CJU89_4239 [Yarrowia sp. B02]|nr:hypothetical protein CJU89_4239 [Yarrowia sp. B02]
MLTARPKRLFVDDDDEERPRTRPRLRRTSMARLIGVDLSDLELLNFFYHHTIVDILSVNDARDRVWIQQAPSKVNSDATIKQACLLLAAMDLSQRRAPAKYLVDNEPHPTYKPVERKEIQGYVPPGDMFMARQLVQFTKLLVEFEGRLRAIRPGDMSQYGDMMLAGTLVYIAGLAMGPLIPLLNFTPGQGDLLGLSRSIRTIHECLTGQMLTEESPYPVVDWRDRKVLPRERDLWATVEMAETHEERLTLYRALYTLIEFYNMDVRGGCITHMTSWPIYWMYSFRELQQARNPHALIMVAYWCAYVHCFHGYSWWRDRAVEDLYSIVDELPQEYHYLVQWPLDVVQSFDVDAEDYLNGSVQTLNF